MSGKANFLLLVLLLGGGVSAQESPGGSLGALFAPDSDVFVDMQKAKIEVCQQDCAEEDLDTDAIRQTYAEIYQSESYQNDGEELFDDAGVVVVEFKEIAGLLHSLAGLRKQPNLLYLTKDRYLIKVWSDSSLLRERHLAAARRFYEGESGATHFAGGEDRFMVDVAESAESAEAVDIVDAVDANGLADYVDAVDAGVAVEAAEATDAAEAAEVPDATEVIDAAQPQ